MSADFDFDRFCDAGAAPAAWGAAKRQAQERKALLLRVGIDRGTGGALSPIYADGGFDYVPIPETQPTRRPLTFAKLPARRGGSLAAIVPRRIADRPAHIDPDFDAFTYGDAALHKRRQLLRLEPGDLLVFYAGFEPWPPQDIPRLFILGWLDVRASYSLTAQELRGDRALRARFGKTAHFLRDPADPELAFVEGDPRRSRLLDRALPLGDGADRLLRDLAALGYRGSLRRAVGHWLVGNAVNAVEDWLQDGPASLVGETARIFTVDPAGMQAAPGCRGDLVVADGRPAIGDWVCSDEESETFALARINARTETGGARASLFWHLKRLPPIARCRIPVPDPPPRGLAVRRLVSWVASQYRIGFHSD
jgi:hypothetical protein